MIALILIFLGIIFLLNNFNLLPLYTWENIWKFWPVILILWGLEVLLGKSVVANLVIMVITVLIVFLLLSYFDPGFRVPQLPLLR